MGADDYLDILGQQPSLNIYTQLSLIYPVPDPSLHEGIVDTLTSGLDQLARAVPWVAGQVVSAEANDGGSARFRVAPLGAAPALVVRDLRGNASAPTMDELRQARFPFRILHEDLVAPQKTIPGVVAGSGPDPTPVFALQANFIVGGLILTAVTQHQTMDFTAQRVVMSLLSDLCRGRILAASDIADANPIRHSRIKLLDDSYSPGPELGFQMAGHGTSRSVPDEASSAPARWAYFGFPRDSLAAIKAVAMNNIVTPPGFVSTDDALTAFIWQSVGRARLSRLGPNAGSTLGRAVDVRRHLGLPPTYPGLIQNLAFHSHPLQPLTQLPLGALAAELRLAVEPSTSDMAYNTRAFATMLDRTADKSGLSFAANIDPSTDILISSWTNPAFYSMDFGLGLGNPEAVRRPCFAPFEGLIYFMPKTIGGEIVVAFCLRETDILRLTSDRSFSAQAIYVG